MRRNVVWSALAIRAHAEHWFSLGTTHLCLPKMVNGITGTPIWSKQALSVAFEGGIHFVVSLISGSFMSLVRLLCQYCIGVVTRQPLPEMGLKQKSVRVIFTP